MDLSFLERVPAYLRKGPWTFEAYLTIALFGAYIVYSHANSDQCVYKPDLITDSFSWLQTFRLIVGFYMLCFTIIFIRATGYFPLISYTMLSWNILTMRLLTAYLAASNHSPSLLSLFRRVSAILKFPALVMNTVTVLVWWFILVPVISYFMSDTKAKNAFSKFNRSVPLLNIHALNLPIAAAEFLWTGIRLEYPDMHSALVICFLYMMFYLLVLDTRGIQIYIIFTPRTRWCIVIFSLIPMLYLGTFASWNGLLKHV